MRIVFIYLFSILLLLGCSSVKKKEAEHFPMNVSLQSYNVVNLIPVRSGKSLDYLLKLGKWAHEKIAPKGFAGVGVMSLIEGYVNLSDGPGKDKILTANIVVSFEIKNDPAYGYSKTYFRLHEQEKVPNKDIPKIDMYLTKYHKK